MPAFNWKRNYVKMAAAKRNPAAISPLWIITYPARFALIFEGLLRVLRGGLNVVHGVLHMVLYAVYHFTLYIVSYVMEEWVDRAERGSEEES